MASYDLKCDDCGHTFEVFVQGFLKDRHKVCPECGSTRVGQLFTGFMLGGAARSEGSSTPAACGPRHGFG